MIITGGYRPGDVLISRDGEGDPVWNTNPEKKDAWHVCELNGTESMLIISIDPSMIGVAYVLVNGRLGYIMAYRMKKAF